MVIELAGEQIELLPERALHWPRRKTLFVADLHWGKAATFRAHGIALPGGTTSADLARLSAIIARTGARRLALLGDLLHAQAGRAAETLAAIAAWRAAHADLDVLLVRGNHDQRAGDPPPQWDFTVANAPQLDAPFVLQHQPATSADGYALAGHIHPAVQLSGAGRQRLRLPCFWLGRRVGVLPAFGSFTGAATVTPTPGDRVYVVAQGEVLAMTEGGGAINGCGDGAYR